MLGMNQSRHETDAILARIAAQTLRKELSRVKLPQCIQACRHLHLHLHLYLYLHLSIYLPTYLFSCDMRKHRFASSVAAALPRASIMQHALAPWPILGAQLAQDDIYIYIYRSRSIDRSIDRSLDRSIDRSIYSLLKTNLRRGRRCWRRRSGGLGGRIVANAP